MRKLVGTNGSEHTMMPPMRTMETVSGNQKRFRIFGISLKKFERSTSFFVAPQVMLYEKRWASNATERWMLRPLKKKKL